VVCSRVIRASARRPNAVTRRRTWRIATPCAAPARRALEQASAELGRLAQFTQLRGDPGTLLAGQSSESDIIALAAAATPAGHAVAALRRPEDAVPASSSSQCASR
jgi:hypothetical protein